MNALGASDRVFHLLDSHPSIPTEGGQTLDALQGRLDFEAVSFSYPARPDVKVLEEVSSRPRP